MLSINFFKQRQFQLATLAGFTWDVSCTLRKILCLPISRSRQAIEVPLCRIVSAVRWRKKKKAHPYLTHECRKDQTQGDANILAA
mmetsp:Transcript_44260/g.71660  ORF Transcript_44260/g.71660 Transcript_44260/m.71660 type:complete len:85 (+) Transcript_44260:71-325(+)